MENAVSYEDALEAALMVEIKMELVATGKTQQELADALEMPKTTLNRYIKGHRSMPLSVLSKVARVLGTSAHELMERAEVRASK